MRFKGGAWKPVVAELRERLSSGSCMYCGESFIGCVCTVFKEANGNLVADNKPIYKMIDDIERKFKYYVQWFGFEKMEFLRMRQKFVDLRRRSLEQYYKDQDIIKELREQIKERE